MSDETAIEQTGGVSELKAVEKFTDFLLRRIEEDKEKAAERAQEIALEQLDRILSAPDREAMFAADDFDSIGGRNLEDVEQRILEITYAASDRYTTGIPLGNGMRAYVLVRSMRLDNGEIFVWNTGSTLIIGKLRWLEADEAINTSDAEVVIKGTATPNGRVLKLKEIPKRAVPGEVVS